MDKLWKIASFIGVQYVLGKRGSFPYGLAVGFSLFKITLLVVVNDIVQTFLLLNCFEYLSRKCSRLKRKKHERKWRLKLREKLEKWGAPGLIAVAALPYGGGALTGSLLAMSIKMDKKKAFCAVAAGCIIGSVIFYLGFTGILSLFPRRA
ncbi:MAG: small multi-drug export protein [bacterium]|nr:small multi-drug export protein [bacterium]